MEAVITNFVYKHDLPDTLTLKGDIAIDCEAMGLNQLRDRLCVVQLSDGNGDAHLVHFSPNTFAAPNLRKLLSDNSRTFILHFARFDVALIHHYLRVTLNKVYCTRTASRLARTYTDKHGYKEICKELLGVDISKQQQSSDWGTAELSKEQIDYAATDVLHLHKLRERLEDMLTREGRAHLATACMAFIPTRALMDLQGFSTGDIFGHE